LAAIEPDEAQFDVWKSAIYRPNNIWVFSTVPAEATPSNPEDRGFRYEVYTFVHPDQPIDSTVATVEGQTGHVETFTISLENATINDMARHLVDAWHMGIHITSDNEEAHAHLQQVVDYILNTGFTDDEGRRYRPTAETVPKIRIHPPNTFTPEPLRPARPRRPQKLRSVSPQQTSPEIKEATIAMADAPLLRGWGLIDGEIALRHAAKDSRHQVKFVIGPLVPCG
jgi:hypothetical protein